LETYIHADRTQPALVHGAQLPWIPSPEPGVERRMLERIGGEVAIASSIVRYRPGSRFGEHTHALGEEFMVLEGIFSDERGDYPAGTYVRNPPGSSHAPGSRDGCTIFVKLRQMRTDEPEQLRVLPGNRRWQLSDDGLYQRALLYSNARTQVSLLRLEAATVVPPRSIAGGEEIFVLEGSVRLLDPPHRQLDTWSWLRHPGHAHPAFTADRATTLWVKQGHLA
jgi:anti-sigma factor ChrR (cupin superfamily)